MKNNPFLLVSLLAGLAILLLFGTHVPEHSHRSSGDLPAVLYRALPAAGSPAAVPPAREKRAFEQPLSFCFVPVAPSFVSAGFSERLGSAAIYGEPGSMAEEKALSIDGLAPEDTPPLDQGMVNVTGEHAGFRMLPHGEFEKDITIILPYDTALIPLGYSEREIYTYYYNESLKRWMMLKRDSVDTENKLVVSKVNHFTDFVNAIIKTPEMPETQAYTPTSIKDLKAADPLDGLPLFQAPAANNNGTANMSYPIEIPAGRQGMQPNLAVTYNSGGGNGWLGIGWDLSIPAITLETRWGVPRYDYAKESEVYLYQGEQLVTKDEEGRHHPMPHRTNVWRNRNSNGVLQFYPRVEEAFDSIVRHGTTPANYWWSVTDRHGVTHYYGKQKGIDLSDPQSVLRDAAGNIAHWALTESVDPYGNSVRYYYEVVTGYNTPTGEGNPGTAIYLSRINYTGFADEDGKYNVVFTRNSSLRKDVQVNGRYGFKEVSGQLLCHVQVFYEQELLSTYCFFTENNRASAHKTRLTDLVKIMPTDGAEYLRCGQTIGELPWGKIEAVRYNFAYYDYPAAGKLFGSGVEMLSLDNDNVGASFRTSPVNSGSGRATALGASKGRSWSVGGTLAVGFGPDIFSSLFSLGGNYNYTNSKSEGLLTLIDLDGDGLPDKVFKQNGELHYRRQNPIGNGEFMFGPKITLARVSDFAKESSSSNAWGLQASAGLTLSADWPTVTSTNTNYFADVNADGLPDLITDKGLFFNTLENWFPTFHSFQSLATTPPDYAASSPTPTYVVTSATAPCGGVILDNGVSDSIMCYTEIEDQGTCKATNVDSLRREGYTVIFENGEYHFYKETTHCEYPLRDPDIDAVKVWVAPRDGTISIYSTIRLLEDTTESRRQSRMANGVRYAVQYNRNIFSSHGQGHSFGYGGFSLAAESSELFSGTLLKDDYNEVSQSHTNLTLRKGDILFFRLQSRDSRVFDNVRWIQEIVYDEVTGTDDYGKPAGRYHSAEDFVLNGKAYFQAPDNGSVRLTGEIRCGSLNRPVLIKVTNHGNTEENYTLYGDTVLQVDLAFPVAQRNNIKIQIYGNGGENTTWGNIRSKFRLAYYGQFAATETLTVSDSLVYYPVPILHMNTGYDNNARERHYKKLFGDLYRGWGQFGYNNNYTGATVTTPIDITRLRVPGYLSAEVAADEDTSAFYLDESIGEDMSQENLTAVFSEVYAPLSSNTSWVEMMADGEAGCWMGFGNINSVSEEIISNTRPKRYLPADPVTGEPEEEIIIYDSPVPVSTDGFPVMTIRKQNESELSNTAFDMGMFITAGSSESTGSNKILTDYMDLNGDRYPDILSQYNVQYTNPWGGLGTQRPLSSHGICESKTSSDGNTFGASYLMPEREIATNPKRGKITFSGSGQIGASHGYGTDHAAYTLQDINGDGLPDKIVGGNKVMLNTGYGFLPEEPWDQGYAQEGRSESYGMSGGANFSFGIFEIAQASIGGGAGMNRAENSTTKALLDINGDGLPDKVTVNNGRLRVSYNMGNGTWSSAVDNIPVNNVSYGESLTELANMAVTGGFTFLSIIKITLGFQTAPNNKHFNKTTEQLIDMDNDGYPDYVISSDETGMIVFYNQASKTNLLRQVTNFTGSRIELDYELPQSSYRMPQRSWNLAQVSTNDPYSPLGGAQSLATFTYEDPYYERYERMGYGYAKITAKEYDTENANQVYRYTEQEYQNRNFIKRGKITREALYNKDGKLYIEKLYEAQLVDMTNGQKVGDEACPSEVFPMYEADIVRYYEGMGEAQITTGRSRTYDFKRNVVEYIQWGDMAVDGDNFTATILYETGMPHNLISLPTEVRIIGAGENVLRHRKAAYNNQGKPVEVKQFNEVHASQTDLEYDSYGNIAQMTFPPNAAGQRHYYRYLYDDSVHSYPVSVSSALGYTSSATYDYRWGKPLETTDINGNKMRYAYDEQGRLTFLWAPSGLGAEELPTIRMAYFPVHWAFNITSLSSPNRIYAVTQHYDSENDAAISTVVLSDGLGRVAQTKKTAEVDGSVKWIVSGKVVYDAFGRVIRQYHPFTEELTPDEMQPNPDPHFPTWYSHLPNGLVNPAFDPATTTESEYDILDRKTRVSLPDQSETVMSYGFGNDAFGVKRFTNSTTDANGNSVTACYDYRQLQTTVTAPLNTITTFRYNPLGELLESVDPDGHSTSYNYTMLGQRISRTHPDAGTTNWKYDLAGNVIALSTANLETAGQAIEYTYHYNRLTEILYPQYPENNVKYLYGGNGAVNNGAGRVVAMEDATGYQSFKYGKLGEVVEETRIFALPFDTNSYSFTMNWEYDNWNRVKKITYPDGEKVFYRYNHGGTLNQVWGEKGNEHYPYINDIRYNEFEAKTAIEYGNGTSAYYQYDILQRLSALTSYASNGQPMQQISYTFDPVSNITAIDNLAGEVNGLGGKYSYLYNYDNLYRLTSSDGNWDNGYYYGLKMEYDSDGKILRKGGSANGNVMQTGYDNYYSYNTDQPHTISKLSDGQQFTWDKNGNMTGHFKAKQFDTRFLAWDEENRLMGVADNNQVSFYLYDAAGERTVKFTGHNQWVDVNGIPQGYAGADKLTLYASPYLVASSGQYTKHYYAGEQRILSKIGGGGLGNYNAGIIAPETHRKKVAILENMVRFIGNTLYLKTLSVKPKPSVPCNQEGMLVDLCNYRNIVHPEEDRYFYHPDHLGSSSWITDRDGMPMQHLAYLPFGEEFVDQKTSNWSAAHKFSGKEKDEETGYNYFGARYYMSDLGIWGSVDPMSDKYPSTSNYLYCRNKPVILVDPNGMYDTDYGVKKNGEVIRLGGVDDKPDRLYAINDDETIKKNRDGEAIMVELKGKMKGKSIERFPGRKDSEQDSRLRFGDNFDDAKEAFRFMDQNTTVEWQLYGHSDEKGIQHDLRTSHLPDASYADIPAIIAKNGNLIYHYHNHEKKHSCYPSSKATNGHPADKEFRDNALTNSPNAKFGIFYEGRLYDYKCTRMTWDCWK